MREKLADLALAIAIGARGIMQNQPLPDDENPSF